MAHGNIVAHNKRLEQIIVDCESNVGEMFSKLIHNSFYSIKYVEYCKKQCSKVINHQYEMLFMKETQLREENVNINEIEEAFPQTRKCDICQEIKIREFQKICK